MDTRGAIGVTERQQFFREMRGLAGRVAGLYVDGRQKLEFPWLDEAEAAAPVAVTKKAIAAVKPPAKPAPLLFEIGTEELPPADLDAYLAQLEERFGALLDSLYLEHGDVRVLGTPRRLVVYVEDLSPQQPDREELVKGPPAARAFGPDGVPTKAAEGFARGKGISVSDLEVRKIDGGEYVVATVKEKGRSSIEVLAEALPELIAGLKVDRTMRWNASNMAFSRPIRWLLALHGESLVPFAYAGYLSRAATRGLRFTEPETVEIKDTKAYFTLLEGQGIILDVEERRASVESQVKEIAASVGGEARLDPDLLAEVTHLIEAPTALLGNFEEKYLSLPAEVLVTVMKKHQRYFPVYKDGKLLPHFITVRNGGDQHLDLIARGNEAVIRARFADAAFFVEEDLKQPLADYVPQLSTLTFQTKLGSMLDKTERIVPLVEKVGAQLGLDKAEQKTARRAARLCKADLVTSMVVEITSLQGFMGQQYALRAGEPEEVAGAIFEHYLPRSAGDMLAKHKPGLAVGIADRLDSLAGLFAAGMAPTGNKDPFALRRAALGLVQSLIGWDTDFDLGAGLADAAANLPIESSSENQSECLEFINGRMRALFLEEGWNYDVVDAVLAAQGHNPAGARKAVGQLAAWVARDDWHEILPAYSRCVRITRDLAETFKVDAKNLVEGSEKDLLAALETAEKVERAAGSVDDLFDAFLPMMPVINSFFDNVLVMDEDDKLRANRLGLLQRIAALAGGVADLSRLEGF
jgi:glycyl-tRNA synthetase